MPSAPTTSTPPGYTGFKGVRIFDFDPGEVGFELGGANHRLVAEPGTLGGLTLNFHDLTNGTSTYDWRKATTAKPRPDVSVIIDFNRAINYPSALPRTAPARGPSAATRSTRSSRPAKNCPGVSRPRCGWHWPADAVIMNL
ncbi:DUF1684 domain-containing protein [Arthrobacter sp. VKM Ac-2550]|uniref:DUF1684 domain-containing protein n=1 Tax=Crystallibacter permensis TaxID=1938888 RepID=UPI002227DF63|nr:DUF1684 domain-containing protein [Arthrobacter sp. VKM Ac-2550]MCW2133917.1 Protein of unknown function (DUF1684) [Arthrobacter sp. VKM Ac-2550]